MYPFLPNDGDRFTQAYPLNPCSHDEHMQLYASVDNTQSSYEEYQAFLDIFSGIPKGHAILAHGASGCGKSSLVYRCINRFNAYSWRRNGKSLTSYLLDFHFEKFSNLSAEEKAAQINELIAEALEEAQITERLSEKFLEKLDANPIRALKFLEIQFKQKNVIPIIYFPNVETSSELDEYLNSFFRSNWILFFESINPNVLQKCKLKYPMASSSNPVKILEVHPLTPQDAVPFLETRLSLLGSDINVEFEQSALERYLRNALGRPSGGASLKEIEIICGHTIRKAIDNNKTTISYSDISDIVASIIPGIC